MPTAVPVLNTQYESKDGYQIIIRLIHGKQQRKIKTGFKVEKKFWNGEAVSSKHPESALINAKISQMISQAKKYFAEMGLHNRPVNLDLVFAQHQTGHSFSDYLLKRADDYGKKDMPVMKRKLQGFAKEIKQCFGRIIYFDEINTELLRQLEAHMIKNKNVNNTRHKKFKFLKQFYDQAVNDKMAELPNPFAGYKIPVKPTRKEKLSLQEIKAIEKLKLKPGRADQVRDLFLFSYYAKGARFENCLMLKLSDIKADRIYFKTNKGEKHLSVKIHDRLRVILDKYKGKGFVFPFVKSAPEDKLEYLKMVDSWNTVVNRQLKLIGILAELPMKLTFHLARHTFAQHLKIGAANIHVIKEAMGHSDIRTTEIYLKALGDESIDVEMNKLYGK